MPSATVPVLAGPGTSCLAKRVLTNATQPVQNHTYGAERPDLSVYSCSAYGVKFELRASPELFTYLPSLIPGTKMERPTAGPALVFGFHRKGDDGGRPLFGVDEGGEPVFASADLGSAVRVLESRAHHQLASLTEEAVFVHAGVVAWRGQGIVIPGPSQSGKSTLVAALVAAGATYYSDEYAVIGLDGKIHAFTRDLRLRSEISGPDSVRRSPANPFPAPLPPLQARWILNLRHRPGSAWEPRVLTPGQSLLVLLANTVAVRRQPELTVKTLKLAVGSATGLHSDRTDAEIAARHIIQMIEAQVPPDTGARSD